jgi:hypothetical protein
VKLDDIKTLVEIVNGIVAIVAILAAGWWFFISRSLAGTLQITLTLTGVTIVNDTRIVIIRVQIKNVGLTRIKKGYCASVAQAVNVRPSSEPINVIAVGPLNYSQGRRIFTSLTEIEPNEEAYEDVAFALNEVTSFAVGVHFKREKTREAWQAIAAFNVDDKAKVPTTTSLPVEQTVR